MTEHNLFYYPYASFTNAQLPLLKVAAVCVGKLVMLDKVVASWATIAAVDEPTREARKLLKDVGILQTVTPADAALEEETVETLRAKSGELRTSLTRDVGTRKESGLD